MTVTLVKYSAPGWQKDYPTLAEATEELRSHICESCLIGPAIYVGEGGELVEIDFDEPPVDVIHDGVSYECRDASLLLGTSCGCEYGLEGDHGLWEQAA